MLTTTQVELFRRRLSRGLYAWNISEVMKTVSEDPKVLLGLGRTLALQKACDMDRNTVSVELIQLLIEEGSRLNFGERGGLRLPTSDYYGSAPLQILVKRGSLQVLKFLSESQPPLLCKEDVATYDLLHFAASQGHFDVVQFLISLDPDAVYKRDHHGGGGLLPIHMTCYATITDNNIKHIKNINNSTSQHQSSIRSMLVKYHLQRYCETHDQSELFQWICPNNGNFTKEEVFIYMQDIASIINRINVSLPILSSAINAGASHTCILQIMHLFKDATKVRDNNNRLPIHQAAEKGLDWHCGGLEDIFYANPSAILEEDSITGLSPVLLAASRKETCSLDSIFELLRRHPTSFFRLDIIHN